MQRGTKVTPEQILHNFICYQKKGIPILLSGLSVPMSPFNFPLHYPNSCVSLKVGKDVNYWANEFEMNLNV